MVKATSHRGFKLKNGVVQSGEPIKLSCSCLDLDSCDRKWKCPRYAKYKTEARDMAIATGTYVRPIKLEKYGRIYQKHGRKSGPERRAIKAAVPGQKRLDGQ